MTSKEKSPIEECLRCGRWARMKPHYCQMCTRKTSRDFVRAKHAARAYFRSYPTLGFEQLMDDPNSDMQQSRSGCFVTASESGVIWNVKRGLSKTKWLKIKAGLQKKPEFNEFVLGLMAEGREQEDKIASYFWNKMLQSYRAVYGSKDAKANLLMVHPGIAMRSYYEIDEEGETKPLEARLGATSDEIIVWYDGEKWRIINVEIKYFASKETIPDETPLDYWLQITCQMACLGTGLTIFWFKANKNNPDYQWRLYQKDEAFEEDTISELIAMRKLLETPDLIPGRFANSSPKVKRHMNNAELGRGTDFLALWKLLIENREKALEIK